jgi:beta-phosphoglucomutase-like phosphatase (HAD superfamily)
MPTYHGTSSSAASSSAHINRTQHSALHIPTSERYDITTLRNPEVYLSALEHLSLRSTPHRCALVAAHIYDIRAAARLGYKTVYVRRVTEDLDEREPVKSKAEGGEVDLVVSSLEELAEVVGHVKGHLG